MNNIFIMASITLTLLASSSAQSQRQAFKKGAVVTATGTLQPEMTVDVSSTVRGRIQQVLPNGNWGAFVKKGEVLAEIDSAVFGADLAIARAGVAEAEAGIMLAKVQMVQKERDLDRAKRLLATGGVNQADFDTYQAAAEVARANLAVAEARAARSKAVVLRAQLDVDACMLRSPIDGVIIDRRVNVGQIVGDSSSAPSLFLIASDPNKLELWATVKKADVTRVANGQKATVTVDAFPNDTYQGRVTQIRLNAKMQKDQVMYTVVIDVENRDRRLLPFLTAEVTIDVGERR